MYFFIWFISTRKQNCPGFSEHPQHKWTKTWTLTIVFKVISRRPWTISTKMLVQHMLHQLRVQKGPHGWSNFSRGSFNWSPRREFQQRIAILEYNLQGVNAQDKKSCKEKKNTKNTNEEGRFARSYAKKPGFSPKSNQGKAGAYNKLGALGRCFCLLYTSDAADERK